MIVAGADDFLACLHPDDRARFTAQVKNLSPNNPSYSASFRFIRPDGREVLLEETGKAEFNRNGRYLRLRGLTRDITERMRAEIRQLLLVRELDHRVKNVLATVAMVAQRTRERSHSMDQFLQVFDGRIHAMANAQALLSRSHWQGVSLVDLVNNSLAPFRVDAPSVKVEGPAVLLSADAVQPIAIVLHELATNASKYGALTMPEGSISVLWHWPEDAKPDLLLDWIETGGPPVIAPAEVGYGTGAIRNLIPYELEGSVDLAYDVDGVRCRIRLPSKWLRPDEAPIEPSSASLIFAHHTLQRCLQRSRSEWLVQRGGDLLQRLGKVRVAGDHDHANASLVQPFHERVGHLALEVDVHQRHVGRALAHQPARSLGGSNRPGYQHAELLE